MLWMIRVVSDRLKAIFAADLALDFESRFLLRQADRKAELITKAAELEQQGLEDLASELRREAETLTLATPLDSILPGIEHLQGGQDTEEDVTRLNGSDNKKKISAKKSRKQTRN